MSVDDVIVGVYRVQFVKVTPGEAARAGILRDSGRHEPRRRCPRRPRVEAVARHIVGNAGVRHAAVGGEEPFVLQLSERMAHLMRQYI